MYTVMAPNHVVALDAATGRMFWMYSPRLSPLARVCCGRVNRGLAILGETLFMGTIDGHLIAIDAKNGKPVWDVSLSKPELGYSFTMAPLIIKDKVIMGPAGGEYGIRGFIAAYDAHSGRERWRFDTIPGPGDPGHDTWPAEAWAHGGGAVWVTGSYDAELNLTYWGTGNASPWFGDQRPGDNLFTSSTVAINPENGKLVSHFQYHWNDSWDWDEPDAPIIADFTKDGKTVKGLIKPARNGYLYRLERGSDAIKFVSATPYVKQNVFKSIDEKTGRPTYNDDRVPKTGKRADFCPSLWGGKDWPFAAYNPKTGMLYIPANDNHCGFMEGKVQKYEAGKWWTGVDIPDIGFAVDKTARHFGEVQAWDISNNKRVWSHLFPDSMNWGPVMTTAGGLVFNGGTNDRYFRAFDASTGEVLWQFRTNSGITAPPSSFAVDGVQYIAVASGWGVDPAFQQGLLSNLLGWQKDVPQGGVVWVFALGQ
jgi:alcohol dehydrogenase (cytochrome c)